MAQQITQTCTHTHIPTGARGESTPSVNHHPLTPNLTASVLLGDIGLQPLGRNANAGAPLKQAHESDEPRVLCKWAGKGGDGGGRMAVAVAEMAVTVAVPVAVQRGRDIAGGMGRWRWRWR
jgi:hypothetical protein